MFGRLLVIGVALLPTLVAAKVTHAALLCLPASGPWLDAGVERALGEFASKVAGVARDYGAPEVTVTAVIAPAGRQGATALALERAVIHRLRASGAELGAHESMPPPDAAEPKDFGCAAHEVALQLEAVFRHPIYR